MANYSFVSSAKFRPFSYQEMLLPLQAYTEEHNAILEGINELGIKADIFSKMANELLDPTVQAIYKQYSKDLSKLAEDLAKNGLTPSSRQGLLDMRRRFASDIIPIELAYNYRKEVAAEQRKLKASNPSIMFDTDFSTIPLSTLMKNPSLGYNTVVGDDLYKKGKEAAIAASARLTEISPALLNLYWGIRQGYGAEAANDFLINNASIPELNTAIERIVSQSGVTGENVNRAIDYTISGIMSGLSYKEDLLKNENYISNLELERLDLARKLLDFSTGKELNRVLGYELPDGRRIKDVGGGRTRVLHPDGNIEIIQAPKLTSTEEKSLKKKSLFTSLDYAGDDFESAKSIVMDTSKAKVVDFESLNSKARKKLIEDLLKYDLTPNDVIIKKVHRGWGSDLYRVIPKNTENVSTVKTINEEEEIKNNEFDEAIENN